MIFGGEEGSITGSFRLRRCNEETRRMGADTMEGIGGRIGGPGCGVAEAFGVRLGSGMEGGELDFAKNLDILIEAAVEPVEEEVVVAFVTRRTLGAGEGEGLRGRDIE